MRLLSHKEVSEKKKVQHTLNLEKASLLQTSEVTRFINKEITRLNQIRKDVKPEQEKIYRDFQNFTARITEQKGQLLNEIALLEERKRSALEPLDNLTNQLADWQQKIEHDSSVLDQRAKELDQRTEELNEQKKFTDKKQQQLAKQETQLRDLQLKASAELEVIAKQEKALSLKQDQLREMTQDLTADSDNKNKDLESREQALKVKQDELDNQRDEIRKDRLHLEAQQQTLKLAFEELKKPHGIRNS